LEKASRKFVRQLESVEKIKANRLRQERFGNNGWSLNPSRRKLILALIVNSFLFEKETQCAKLSKTEQMKVELKKPVFHPTRDLR
jgi:hypothetical protein